VEAFRLLGEKEADLAGVGVVVTDFASFHSKGLV
jgi:hypothetical protein